MNRTIYYVKCNECGWQSKNHYNTPSGADAEALDYSNNCPDCNQEDTLEIIEE